MSDGLIPISRLASRYYIYEIEDVKHCREQYNILGVFVGTLPQHHQQNVFLGLPMELMGEEARLLVDLGVAYIVDDLFQHTVGLRMVAEEERQRYMRALARRGQELAKADVRRAEDRTRQALDALSPEKRAKVEAKRRAKRDEQQLRPQAPVDAEKNNDQPLLAADTLKDSEATLSTPSPTPSVESGRRYDLLPKPITPTTSQTLIAPPAPSLQHAREVPKVHSIASYALFKYLHERGFFMSPGLRFGCQFCVYPGDPLRYHSHFLARGYRWDDDIDLLGLVGGGRLGTGVKKAFLIGGPRHDQTDESVKQCESDIVRCFSIEWAGM